MKTLKVYTRWGVLVLLALLAITLHAVALNQHSGEIVGKDWKITPTGGNAFRGSNATGAVSIEGTVICVGPTAGAVVMASADTHPCGVFLESGISDGERIWTTVSGPAYVLLEDGTGAARGDWLMTSSQPGRAIANTKPTALGIPELYQHQRQIGYAVEDVAPGVDVMCLVFLKLI